MLGGHEGQPLVVKNTMYVVTPWPNVLYAFDLTQEGYPLRWKYRPDVSPNSIGVACCDSINRGAFYADGKIIYNLLDGHTVAVDADSGREIWKTKIAEVAAGETTTIAPLVVRDRVIVGAAGGEFGIYGWVKALNLKDGQILWTAHNIGPDAGMLVHADTFKPPYDSGADLGARSWANDSWKVGGAPVWGWMAFDPELDLIYYGTGNPAPYNPEQRVGDNKWSSSVLARRPEDGALVWAYQFTPHDNWDYDSTGAMILADRALARRGCVRARELGEVGGSGQRPAGVRAGQADRGVQRQCERHLSESRRRGESGLAGRVLTPDASFLHVDQQPVHGLRGVARLAPERNALRRRG
ncbi:MAG: hypothetical protein E6K52_14925 [Gammaproteobacteria bacterium]|nr:MAG: hypothetical protein E6K52_14925 [Gammaproteobacteria bacterium]